MSFASAKVAIGSTSENFSGSKLTIIRVGKGGNVQWSRILGRNVAMERARKLIRDMVPERSDDDGDDWNLDKISATQVT